MAQDDQQRPAKANKRTRNSDPRHRERIAQLVQRRSELTPEEAALLREVFPEIVEAHEDLVWDFLRKRGLNKEDAEDLQPETFITLLLHILDHGFPNSLPGMLLTMAEGKFRNLIATRKRSPISIGLQTSGSTKPKSGPDVIDILNHREVAQRLFPLLSLQHQDVIEKVLRRQKR